uniref:Uncharacterized protein n=1 Tax=Candidatus Kentrum sp. FW TaxID=2126338 RepID=A0A450SVG0_9GAMM|nr:MAG: hypothetical protein BECKFW1821B_GA0114236_102035 [Candidatus Kentron sp. FW]VFJ57948.1 MAG: hypothetical protein BECKFW1821A_GA0114235_107619 [Candidatus Kentron sp. FW]
MLVALGHIEIFFAKTRQFMGPKHHFDPFLEDMDLRVVVVFAGKKSDAVDEDDSVFEAGQTNDPGKLFILDGPAMEPSRKFIDLFLHGLRGDCVLDFPGTGMRASAGSRQTIYRASAWE